MLRRLPLAIGAIAAALITVACGSSTDSGLQGVRDSERQMFFEIPSDWAVYQSADLTGLTETPFVTQDADLNLPVFSRVVFQGAGVDAGIPAVNTSNLEYPVGAAVVRTIPSALRPSPKPSITPALVSSSRPRWRAVSLACRMTSIERS